MSPVALLGLVIVLGQTPQSGRELRTSGGSGSNGGRVESEAANSVMNVMLFFLNDREEIFFNTTLRDFQRSFNLPETTVCKLFSEWSGRTESEIARALAVETDEGDAMMPANDPDIQKLQRRIRLREFLELRSSIQARRERLASLLAKSGSYTVEARRLRECQAFYERACTLRARASLNVEEERELRKMGSAVNASNADDLKQFGAHARRKAVIAMDDAQHHFVEWLLCQIDIAEMELELQFKIWNTDWANDRRDRAALQKKLEAFSPTDQKRKKLVRVRDLIPSDRWHQAYLELLKLSRSTEKRFYYGESADGSMELTAAVNAVSPTRVQIGIDGSDAAIMLTGKDRLIIRAPTIAPLEVNRVDQARTLDRLVLGLREIATLPGERVDGIECDPGPKKQPQTVNFHVTSGTRIDLQEFNATMYYFTVHGAAQLICSGTPDRTYNRMTLVKPERRMKSPAVISIPATLKLTQAVVSFNGRELVWRLDCQIECNIWQNPGFDLDVQLRHGEKTTAVPVVRDGKLLFSDVNAMLAMLDSKTAALTK